MDQDNAVSIANLIRIAFTDLSSPDSMVVQEIPHYFPLLSTLTPVSSLLELKDFFHVTDFENPSLVHTVYGTLPTFAITRRLQQSILRRNSSLKNITLLNLTKLFPPYLTVRHVLQLSDSLFRDFLIVSFQSLWFPLTHVLAHKHYDDQVIPADLQTIFSFLTNPSVFERMHDSCRDIQLFLFSWLQYVHFYSASDDQVESGNYYLNFNGIWHPDRLPLVQPHWLSQQLLSNLHKLIQQASELDVTEKDQVATRVVRISLFALKVANFLCESTEYDYVFLAGKAILRLVRTMFSSINQHYRTRLKLEYETICIMLRAMNAHSLYSTDDAQRLFQQQVPSLLKSIKQHDLFLSNKGIHLPALPPSVQPMIFMRPSVTNLVKLSSSAVLDEQPGENDIPIGPWGPSGDASSSFSNSFDFGELPQPNILNINISTTAEQSAIVQNLLNDASQQQLNGSYMYAQMANYHYAMCKYELAYQYTLLAVEHLRDCSNLLLTPSIQVTIEVLRVMSRLCLIKRKYDLALKIIKHALKLTRIHFGMHNLVYAHLLIEYGCLMLNTDKTCKAIKVNQTTLALVLNSLPGANLMSTFVLDELAYALYVVEYTSGPFTYALNCAEFASLLLRRLNNQICMQAASVNRIKALIIEEIAVDDIDSERSHELLCMARELHLESLSMCERTFGIWNLQTAKHFGNLGRLYQSMHENKEAEKMHLKAITIKERLLGSADYEVSLSLGHLASLYNYDMDRYKEAEQLYLRSIQININLFGSTYTGLEYDYRGLQSVYHELGNQKEERRYQEIFEQWQRSRARLRVATEQEDAEYEVQLVKVCCFESDETALWAAFLQLATAYELEFNGIFRGLELFTVHATADVSCSTNCLVSSACGSEGSRPTGH